MEALQGYPQKNITKEALQADNSQLARVYESKKFVSIDFKIKGCALGSICRKETDTRSSPTRWMSKVGMPSGLLREDELSIRSRTVSDMNIDTILEKIACDLYQVLGMGLYKVPKTRLVSLPILEPFTQSKVLAQHFAEQGITLTLRVIARFVKDYLDFEEVKTLDENNQPISFMDYLKNNHRPPETVLTPDGRPVRLTGFLALLAVARLVADTDVVGGAGGNAGVRWLRNEEGVIVSARTVKIDPGYAFQFTEERAGPVNRALNTIEKNKYGQLLDIKDLQIANNQTEVTIFWKELLPQQKESFLSTLRKNQSYLEPEIVQFLFYRDGCFNRSHVEKMPLEVAQQLVVDMQNWMQKQLEIYLDRSSDLEVEQSIKLSAAQKPPADQFLEILAYLQKVPRAFFTHWLNSRFPDSSVDELQQQLLNELRIEYTQKTEELRIKSAVTKQLLEQHSQNQNSQDSFNRAFQALQDWVAADPLKRGETCLQSLNLAKANLSELWDKSPPELRSSLCQIAGKWVRIYGYHPTKAIGLLNEALSLSSDEERKKAIALELQLSKPQTLHDKLPKLLHFAVYLSPLPRSFLSDWLGISLAEANQVIQELVAGTILRDRGKFIKIRSKPRRALIEEQGGLQQEQLNEAVQAFVPWLNRPEFVLETDGEACASSTNRLRRNREVARLWDRVPSELRVEMYLYSARWLHQYGEAKKRATKSYQIAQELCADNQRKEEILMEYTAFLEEGAEQGKPRTSLFSRLIKKPKQ